MVRYRIVLALIFVGLVVHYPREVGGQESPTPAVVKVEQSPLGSLNLFLKNTVKGSWKEAEAFVEFPSGVSSVERRDIVERVSQKLNTNFSKQIKLSDKAEGDLYDGLPADKEVLITLNDQGEKVLLKRLPSSDGRGWAWILEYPQALKILKVTDSSSSMLALPEEVAFLKDWSVGVFSVADILSLLSLLLVVLLSAYVFRKIIILILRKTFKSQVGTFKRAAYPLQLLLSIVLIEQGLDFVEVTFTSLTVLKRILVIASVLNLLWFLYIVTDIVGEMFKNRLEREEKKLAAGLVPLFQRVVNVILSLLLLLYTLDALGVNINALIAGLGVGGIAVALASQKTIENLFGGVVLFFDQPVKVGQFGRYGDVMGIIEDIGLRSTRIRTISRTIVSVPNADLIQRQIENFATRDKILFHRTIGVRYETTVDQMRFLLASLRKLLLSLQYVDNQPARVRFVAFGDYSLNIEIFCYIKTTDFPEFLSMQEDLLLRIMDTVEAAGTDFAFPSQTLYLDRSEKFGAGSEAPTAQVKAWREGRGVPLPDYTVDEQNQFLDTIPFPDENSALSLKRGA